MALEVDVRAAEYIHTEILKREVGREKRDREFWIRAFGGEVPASEDELMIQEVITR